LGDPVHGWLDPSPFHAPNNVNGVEGDLNGDGRGLEYNTLIPDDAGRRVREIQEAYVRKVIDTVNDLDNVLYEICNEAHGDSTEWQYHLIRFVKDYESRQPKQHPWDDVPIPGGSMPRSRQPGGLDFAEPG
jgi:hypothetical protein